MARYVLLKPDKDGCFSWLSDATMEELLKDPIGYASVQRFVGVEKLDKESDPMYWEDGEAMLLKVEVVLPKPVTTAWAIK